MRARRECKIWLIKVLVQIPDSVRKERAWASVCSPSVWVCIVSGGSCHPLSLVMRRVVAAGRQVIQAAVPAPSTGSFVEPVSWSVSMGLLSSPRCRITNAVWD